MDRWVWTISGTATLFCTHACAHEECNTPADKPKRIAWNPSAQSAAAQAAMERACCDSCGLEIGSGAGRDGGAYGEAEGK
jgi:hypothetical protein